MTAVNIYMDTFGRNIKYVQWSFLHKNGIASQIPLQSHQICEEFTFDFCEKLLQLTDERRFSEKRTVYSQKIYWGIIAK